MYGRVRWSRQPAVCTARLRAHDTESARGLAGAPANGANPLPRSAPLRAIRWSGPALTEGVIESKLDGVPVRITTAAGTVADCFKHRSTVGLDVAIEALRDYRRRHVGTVDELIRAAKVSCVQQVMQPYVVALAAVG